MTSKQIVLKDLFNDLVNFCQKSVKILGRKKSINYEEGSLPRCLSVWDLTALSIGSTLGTGVYVLTGAVAKEFAGPAVIFSFLIAAIASLLAGLCYAEFGARVPKAGSAYAYSYVCIGEFIAFLMGWNLIMEYVIGAASVVKAFSEYLDLLLNGFIKQTLLNIFPINISGFAQYPDFFSFCITLIFSLALAFGAKESSMVNNVFTIINLSVIVFVIFCGSVVVYSKNGFQNWNLRTMNVPKGHGVGGFLPYGISGILKGASRCFYGFIGFDCIATAGEEAKNPQKSIPLATVISLFVIFLTYFGISSVLTLMVPYYDLDEKASLARVFENLGWTLTKNAITYGALFALCASLLGSLFPLPRIIFAMSQDGLLFKVMGKVHKKFQTPFAGTLTAGFLTGCMSCIFDLHHLISMMSIGTLTAYSIVAVCVLILRYEDKKDEDFTSITFTSLLKQGFRPNLKNSTRLSSTLVTWLVTIFCFTSLILAFHLRKFDDSVWETDYWLIPRTCILFCSCFVILFMISRQPTPGKSLTFSVPGVPWIPGLSILINVYLMTQLDTLTWIQLGIWILIGLVIYFSYSINHSNESNKHCENGKSISLQTLKL